MHQVRWYHSIRFRLPAILALTIIIPILFFWWYFSSTSRENVLQSAVGSIYTNVYGSSLLMESTMSDISGFSQSICDDPAFIRQVESFLRTGGERERAEISLALSQYMGEQRGLQSMFLLMEEADVVITTLHSQKELPVADGLGQTLYGLYREVFIDQIGWYMLPSDGSAQTLSCVRPVRVGGGLGGCTLVLGLKSSSWDFVTEPMGFAGSELYITQYDGRLLLPIPAGEPPNTGIREQPRFAEAFRSTDDYGYYRFQDSVGELLVLYYNAVEGGWKYLVSVPMTSVLASLSDQYSFVIIAIVLGALSVLLGSVLLYRSVVKPIRFLSDKLRDMESGELEPLPEARQKDEIGALLRSYNRMTVRLGDMINEVYVQQLLRKQAQLSSLQSQMDEHFLYNTINTVYCEACREKADNTADMLLGLSKYYRLSLAEGKDKVPLSEIADLVRAYLRIQMMRFHDTLTCRVEAFPDMDRYVALKYLFQPIVENAIVHGFEKQPGKHLVRIVFRKDGGLLRFSVSDDGAGFPHDRLEAITRELATFQKAEGDSFALKNVQEQIRITYGHQYRIEIESEQGRGSCVRFAIPLERRDDDAG